MELERQLVDRLLDPVIVPAAHLEALLRARVTGRRTLGCYRKGLLD